MTRAQAQAKKDFHTMYGIARQAIYDNDIMRKHFPRMYHFMDYEDNRFFVGLKSRITNLFICYDFSTRTMYYHYYGKTIVLYDEKHTLNRVQAYIYFGVK